MVTAHTHYCFFQQIMGKGDEMFAETGVNMIKKKKGISLDTEGINRLP